MLFFLFIISSMPCHGLLSVTISPCSIAVSNFGPGFSLQNFLPLYLAAVIPFPIFLNHSFIVDDFSAFLSLKLFYCFAFTLGLKLPCAQDLHISKFPLLFFPCHHFLVVLSSPSYSQRFFVAFLGHLAFATSIFSVCFLIYFPRRGILSILSSMPRLRSIFFDVVSSSLILSHPFFTVPATPFLHVCSFLP